jgi:class III poly(R)-hydroxyalkanoic acid synthase PhaE subunit
MTGSTTINEQWLSDWFEQQRALLEQSMARPNAQARNEAPAAAPPFNPFEMGEDLLRVWHTAWATADAVNQSASGSFAELLGRMPGLGLAREQTQAWRDLSAARADCAALEQQLRTVLFKVQSDALAAVQEQLRTGHPAHGEVQSFRDLYALWIESAERIYMQTAHTEAFCRLQGDLGNATLRLRSHQQRILEYTLKQFDLPTRAELNSVHLQLRELKQRLGTKAPERAARKVSRGPAAKPAASRNTASSRGRKQSAKRTRA